MAKQKMKSLVSTLARGNKDGAQILGVDSFCVGILDALIVKRSLNILPSPTRIGAFSLT